MKLPPVLDIRFAEFLQVIPEDFQDTAREFRAFVRPRKVKSPLQLLELVMLYCGLDLSLRGCAGEVAQAQGYLTDTAVQKRLAACVPWVKALLSEMFGLRDVVNSGSLRFIVIDGSTVQAPGATGTSYRLHIAIDLINLTIRQIEVSTDKVGEHLDHYQLDCGDVVLIDRGYNQPKTLIPFLDRGGDVILRYNAHSMNLYEEKAVDDEMEMIKIDWEAHLKKMGKQPGCVPAYLCHKGKRIRVYLHAVPLPPEKAAEARRQARKRSKKKGGAAEKTLYLSEWVLVLSSVIPEVLTTETVGALYRVRWQVELVIKRLKSLLDVDELRSRKGSKLSDLYLHGKLLYAVAVEKVAQKRYPAARRKMDGTRKLTDWRLWQTVADSVKAGIKSCFPPKACYTADYLRSIAERPRKRKLQTMPEKVMELIEFCRIRGVSAC